MDPGKKIDKKRDAAFIRLFQSRITYLFILLGAIVYLFQDDKILNEPMLLIVARWSVAALIIFLILYKRIRKFNYFYSKEIKHSSFLDKTILLAAIVISSYILQSFLSIPINIAARRIARNHPIENIQCPITNAVTTGIDKIHFSFLDKSYSRYFNINGITRNELINNYVLLLRVRKSIFKIYYIESMQLKKVDSL